MKGIIVNGENGKYSAEVIFDIYDNNGEIDDDKIMERNAWLADDDIHTVYIVEYNGEMYFPIFFTFEDIEAEFDDRVTKALKKKGYFSSYEDDDNADEDNDVEIKLFTLTI